MLIFDIGSNRYEFVEACLGRYDECMIVAVDPLSIGSFPPHLRETADRLIRRYGSQIVPVTRVVSATSGEKIPFYVNAHEPGMSTASKYFLERSRFALGNDNILEAYRQEGLSQGVYDFPDLASYKKAILEGYPDVKSFLSALRHEGDGILMAETITLDDLIMQHGIPDLIKIDVEGHEPEVLRGLSQRVPKICFEWNEEMDSQLWESLGLLKELGYTQFGVSGRFVEGSDLEKLSYDEGGDTYLLEPTTYHTYDDIVAALKPAINMDRRINWGMGWVQKEQVYDDLPADPL